MASIVKTRIGYMVQLSPHEDPQRPKISLGKIKERDAIGVCRHIETLVAVKNGSKMPTDTQKWAEGICHGLRSRLEALGLLERKERDRWTVSSWVQHFIETSTKPDSDNRRKITNVGERLQLFFGKDPIASVTTFQCRRFRDYLKEKVELGENTIRRHIGICRQIFNGAIEAGIIQKNPFLGQPVTVQPNPSRFFYVTPEHAQNVLEAMPNAEWRLIFGLARWGGLRCPSEVVALKWSDIDWERSRFIVHSPKTERHIGHGQRTVPMFPELKPLFQDAFDKAEPGAIYCVDRYKDGKEVNLRTMFDRYLERAKIPVWDKPFQNCRSTRESELFKLTNGNIKAVTSWMGNSPEIALKHYAQLQEADLRQAAEQSIVGTAEEKVSESRAIRIGAGFGAQRCRIVEQ